MVPDKSIAFLSRTPKRGRLTDFFYPTLLATSRRTSVARQLVSRPGGIRDEVLQGCTCDGNVSKCGSPSRPHPSPARRVGALCFHSRRPARRCSVSVHLRRCGQPHDHPVGRANGNAGQIQQHPDARGQDPAVPGAQRRGLGRNADLAKPTPGFCEDTGNDPDQPVGYRRPAVHGGHHRDCRRPGNRRHFVGPIALGDAEGHAGQRLGDRVRLRHQRGRRRSGHRHRRTVLPHGRQQHSRGRRPASPAAHPHHGSLANQVARAGRGHHLDRRFKVLFQRSAAASPTSPPVVRAKSTSLTKNSARRSISCRSLSGRVGCGWKSGRRSRKWTRRWPSRSTER